MKKIILSILLLPAFMTSCSLYGKYQQVEEVDPQIYGEDVEIADSTNFGDVQWREIFKDPILQNHIDSVLVRNADMQKAYLKVEQAKAALMTARLSYVPSFNISPSISHNTVEFGAADPVYNLPINASWEVDIFGKLTSQKRMAKEAYLQTKEFVQAMRTQLIAATANTYYTLLMLDAQYDILVETERIWKESVEATRALKEAGYTTEAALAQTEATYYGIFTSMLDMEDKILQTENAMSMLLFDTPRHIERGRLADQDFTEEFSIGIPVQILSNRPDVKMAEHALAQAFYATNKARAAFYPSLKLNGSIGWTNSLGGVVFSPLKAITSVVGSLMEPLFNRGLNVAQLRIARAQQEEAKLDFTKTLLNAGKEVNEALAAYQTAHNKSEYYAKQVESLGSAAESTSLLMQYGSTTYLEVLMAQQSLLTAQLNQVANRVTEIQQLVTLYKALGGGREIVQE